VKIVARTIIGLLAITPVASPGQSAQADLEDALQRLSEQREAIAEEKAELLTAYQALESEIREKRRAWERLKLKATGRDPEFEARSNEVEAMEARVAALNDAVEAQRDHLETTLHAAELTELAAIELDPSDSLAAQWTQLMSFSIDRIQAALGGEARSGQVVASSGEVIDGQYLLFGPLAFFQQESGTPAGFAVAGDGLTPSLVPFQSTADQGELGKVLTGKSGALPLDPSAGHALNSKALGGGMVERIRAGGAWIWPILFLALVAAVTASVKLIQIGGASSAGEKAFKPVWNDLERQDWESAQAKSESMPAPLRNLLAEALARRAHSREALEDAMLEQIIRWQLRWERGLPILAVTAAVAPLLGLLGTVTGMIATFEMIGTYGSGEARPLSGGIAEALVTTEFGLLVAIPALIAHALLSRQVQSLVAGLEAIAARVVDRLQSSTPPSND